MHVANGVLEQTLRLSGLLEAPSTNQDLHSTHCKQGARIAGHVLDVGLGCICARLGAATVEQCGSMHTHNDVLEGIAVQKQFPEGQQIMLLLSRLLPDVQDLAGPEVFFTACLAALMAVSMYRAV